MSIQVASSSISNPAEAADEIRTVCAGMDPVFVIYFASSHYNPDVISDSMKEAFPDATVVGCSTAGEIISGKMLKNSVVAMAFDKDAIAAVAASPVDLKDPHAAGTVLTDLAGVFGKKPLDLDPSEYVGIILIDGLSCAEEHVMEKIGDITNIPVIGGSAGDDLAFSKTNVYYNGRVFSNAAVLVLLKPSCRFDIIKTQSFCGLGKKLIPTKVDAATRKVLEFNGKPAITAYAEAVGVSTDKVTSEFMKHPVGLISGSEPFVRSPQRVDGDALCFYCQIRDGVDLEILESTDIIEDTKEALNVMEKKVGEIKGLINFNCILRTLQLEQEGKTGAYGELFTSIPTIGFSTYGEEYIGHINQTATMLVFY
ncbi:MAG TPA: FIST N-terminal domain-containing protein [Methanospirillum sp.]|nr:FIST N-terminal domain-containing protein [Methanospirillum sp.]